MRELSVEDLKKLQQVELSIFKQFVYVCSKLDLKYYIIGGTLLGAIRHKGFIPWDDDIDIVMPRKDYDVFIASAQEHLPSKYFLQTNWTDKNFPLNYCKIRDCDTTFVEEPVCDLKMNHGVYIDIFPLDFHPDKEKKIKQFELRDRILKKIISKKFYQDTKKLSLNVKIKIIFWRMFFAFYPYKKAVTQRDKLIRCNKGNKYVSNYCGVWGKKEVVPLEWFGDGVDVCFEGLNVKAPSNYDKWLSQVYGDYLVLPPKEKQYPHHNCTIFDLEKSYKSYLN